MIDPDEDTAKVVGMAGTPATHEKLPYRIELWDLPRQEPERVLARAASAQLARAIFAAARSEHLGRCLVLRRGSKVIARSE